MRSMRSGRNARPGCGRPGSRSPRGWTHFNVRYIFGHRVGVTFRAHPAPEATAATVNRLREPIEGRDKVAKRSISTLTRRLREAGFEREFVRRAILPDWWDQSCRSEPDLLPEIEIRVGRFLGVPMSVVTDPESMLAAPGYPKARLRCVRDVDRDRLTPAIHAATGIAGAVVRNLNESVPAPAPPPPNGLAWRQELPDLGGSVDLDTILKDLWARGIPVVPTQLLPAPSFQGLAAVVEDRPVVVLGHRHDEPGRAAFRISHEAGHIARGDCMPGAPVVDKDEEIVSDDEMERFADRYAMRVSWANTRFLNSTPVLSMTSDVGKSRGRDRAANRH